MQERYIYEFRNWMDENDLSISYVAKEFNMSRRTVAGWRVSEDTPEWLKYMMDGWKYRKMVNSEDKAAVINKKLTAMVISTAKELKIIKELIDS